jgi:hypothetical protein
MIIYIYIFYLIMNYLFVNNKEGKLFLELLLLYNHFKMIMIKMIKNIEEIRMNI